MRSVRFVVVAVFVVAMMSRVEIAVATTGPNCTCNSLLNNCPKTVPRRLITCAGTPCKLVKNCKPGGQGCDRFCILVRKKIVNKISNTVSRSVNGILGGAGFDGHDAFPVESPNVVLGHNCNVTQFQQADDFTITAEDAGVSFTAGMIAMYQAGAGPDVAISKVLIEIWNVMPTTGGSAWKGDMVTNRLLPTGSTGFSGVYRTTAGNLTDNQRPIKMVSFDMSWVGPLPQGDYWIVFGAVGAATFAAPEISVGFPVEASDNSRVFDVAAGVWSENSDPTTSNPSDLPFNLYEIEKGPAVSHVGLLVLLILILTVGSVLVHQLRRAHTQPQT